MESMSRESGRFGGIAKAVVFGLQGPGFDSQHQRGFSQGLPAVVHPATPSIGGVRSTMGARFDGNEHIIGRNGMPAFSQVVFRVPKDKECPLVLVIPACRVGPSF